MLGASVYDNKKIKRAREVNVQLDAATRRMVNGKSGGNLPSVVNAKQAAEMVRRKGKK